jgi:hypothetical protein
MNRVATLSFIFTCFVACLMAQQQQLPLPDLPADIPKDALIRMVLTDGTPSGQDAIWKSPDGTIHEFSQFNDRGRGPKIYTTYRLDPRGLVVAEVSQGVDYMKNPVEERFSIASDEASWKNQAEEEKQANAAGKFYVDLNGGAESSAILARALLKNGGKLPVLPSGEAGIRKMQSVPVENGSQKHTASLYEITGLGFAPNYLWLDENQQFMASISGWFAVIQRGFESAVPTLRESQQHSDHARSAELSLKLTHKPSGDLVLTNVTVFDSQTGTLVPDQRVTVHGDRISAVEPDRGQPTSATSQTSQTINGKGKILLPGLWDMCAPRRRHCVSRHSHRSHHGSRLGQPHR